MMFEKLLSLIIYPLGLTLILLSLGIILLCFKKPKAGLASLACGTVWLLVWSLPPVSDRLVRSLEETWSYVDLSAVPNSDLILVLGGVVEPPSGAYPHPDLNAAADRLWHTARLYHAGKAELIVLTGGANDWETGPSQAALMREVLVAFGVPNSRIILEESSRNTYENAVFSLKVMRDLEISNPLLVTSALHMPRATAVFQAMGVDHTPIATDFLVRRETRLNVLNFVPSVGALNKSTLALHEYIGMAIYKIRGQI